jgi:uncharacterized membrane protein SirB2
MQVLGRFNDDKGWLLQSLSGSCLYIITQHHLLHSEQLNHDKMKSIAIQLCALIVTLLTITIGSATADATFTPILPPSYPLAVRNPYLSGEFFRRLHNSH